MFDGQVRQLELDQCRGNGGGVESDRANELVCRDGPVPDPAEYGLSRGRHRGRSWVWWTEAERLEHVGGRGGYGRPDPE